MKKRFLIFCFLFPLFCKSQFYAWAKQAITNAQQARPHITCDAAGNVLMAGQNTYLATYGTVLLTAGGFFVKYTPAGNFLWGRNVAGEVFEVQSDQFCNIYVGANQPDHIELSKYDSSGTLLWKKSYGQQETQGRSMSVSSVGTIYITGYFSAASTSFDSLTTTDSSSTYSHLFFGAINSSGTPVWLHRGPQDNYTYEGGNIIYVFNDRIYLSGYANSCEHGYCTNCFLFMLDTTGNILNLSWPVDPVSEIEGIAVDKANNVYLSTSYTNQYFGTTFIEKYNTSFQKMWSRNLGGSPGYDYCFQFDLVCDGAGNTFISGNMGHEWSKENDTVYFNGSSYPLRGSIDVAVLSFDSSGNIRWLRTLGGTGGDLNGDLCRDTTGNCYMAAYLNAGKQNDTLVCANDTLRNDGNWMQLFVAKLGSMQEPLNTSKYSESFEVSPNPTSGKIYLHCSPEARWVMKNYSGQLIATSCIRDNKEIDLTNIPPGIYFLELISDRGQVVRKIVRE